MMRRRVYAVLPLAALTFSCQVLAGIDDITYAPDGSIAVAAGSSGSSQAPGDGAVDDGAASGASSGSGSGSTSGVPTSGADTSGAPSGAPTSGSTVVASGSGASSGAASSGTGSTSGSAAGATSGSGTSGVARSGAASGSATGAAAGSSGSGGAAGKSSGSPSGSATGSATGSASGSGGAGMDAGLKPKCKSAQLVAKGAAASSVEGQSDSGPGIDVAYHAIDGDFTTRWGSLFMTDPSWIDVDYGAPVFIDEVDILWESACATAYGILVSNDALTWTPVKLVAGAPPTSAASPPGWTNDAGMPLADVQKGLSAFGRYLRVNGTARCLPNYGYSIWEMRAFGDTNAACSP